MSPKLTKMAAELGVVVEWHPTNPPRPLGIHLKCLTAIRDYTKGIPARPLKEFMVELVPPPSNPFLVTKVIVEFDVSCRNCGDIASFRTHQDCGHADGSPVPDPSLIAHEHLEDQGWIDRCCPRCVPIVFPTSNEKDNRS